MDLVKKIIKLNKVFSKAELPFAFGGALALAWCTKRARGTIDIDVNIFIEQSDFQKVLSVLPKEITCTPKDKHLLKQQGQVRLWWDKTPLDIFLNTTPYHQEIQSRIQREEFSGVLMPFLACQDLAVFKVFYNRTKDWADLEEMCNAGTLNIAEVRRIIVEYLGVEDVRVSKLDAL